MVVGARSTAFRITLQPNLPFLMRFTDYTIPADAQILDVHYYPEQYGGLVPIETHGVSPKRYSIPAEVSLYPMPRGDKPAKETQVNVEVIWAPDSGDAEVQQQLVNAFQAYAIEDYHQAILSANIAVESTLARILQIFLEQVAAKKKVEDFLTNSATYSYQLNIVLPALLSFTNAPLFPDTIRGLLNRLRDLRNDIVHRGTFDKPLTKNEVAECLCAALFGFHYLRLIRPVLLTKKQKE